MQVVLDSENFISSYAVIGEVLGGIEVEEPKDIVHFESNYRAYRLAEDKKSLSFSGGKAERIEEELLLKAKEKKQEANNQALAKYLSANPLLWTDGIKYGVTQSDQQEIALNLTQYQLAVAAGQEAKLEWHGLKEECRSFTPQELSGLAMAITAFVYPLVRKNQGIKTAIFAAKTMAELEGIELEY